MFASVKADPVPDVRTLEAAEATARSAFACAFSTADEYESALIAQRRAAGLYASAATPVRNWMTPVLIGCVCVLASALILLT